MAVAEQLLAVSEYAFGKVEEHSGGTGTEWKARHSRSSVEIIKYRECMVPFSS
jgi:hypothetical protein